MLHKLLDDLSNLECSVMQNAQKNKLLFALKNSLYEISLCLSQRKRKSFKWASWRKYDIPPINYTHALYHKPFHTYNCRKYIMVGKVRIFHWKWQSICSNYVGSPLMLVTRREIHRLDLHQGGKGRVPPQHDLANIFMNSYPYVPMFLRP